MFKFKRKSDPIPAQNNENFDSAPSKGALTPAEQRHLDLLNKYIGGARELAEVNQKLAAAYKQIEKLSELAYFDNLTKLGNRLLLEESFKEAVKSGEQIVIVYVDLKEFKKTNDTYGHKIGDQALILAANTLASITRSTDLIARIPEHEQATQKNLAAREGGDEFVLLFTGTSLNELQGKVENLKAVFSNLSFQSGDKTIPVLASIGAYEYEKGDTLEHCKIQADIAMYKHKKADQADGAKLSVAWHASPYTASPSNALLPTIDYKAVSHYLTPKPEPL